MIERRTPLKRGGPIRRGKPPRKVGRKGEREADAIAAFRSALYERSAGWCEAMNVPNVCTTRGWHRGSEPQHLWPEDRDRGMHVPSRGLWLCHAAHAWAHANPEEAAVVGLLRPCECVIRLADGYPTDEQAVAAAREVYDDDPTVRSVLIEFPLGRMVVPPPGVAVEWRA